MLIGHTRNRVLLKIDFLIIFKHYPKLFFALNFTNFTNFYKLRVLSFFSFFFFF